MTISSTTRKAGPFSGNGVTTIFSFTFKVFQASDVLVVLTDASGAETTQTLTSQYTVSLNANQDSNPGGSVTMLTAPPSGYKLTIGSQIAYSQNTLLTNAGGFYPTVINDALDRVTALIQQLLEKVSRTLSLPFSAPSNVSATLPLPSALKVIGWDATGTSLQNYSGADLGTSIAYGQTSAQTASGDGSTTTFTLSSAPTSVNNVKITIGGLTQRPGIDYTLPSPYNITFTTPPPAGTNNILFVWQSALAIGAVADLSVSTAKIVDQAVTAAKIADANVTTTKIADQAVNTQKLADLSVSTAKIVDQAVTAAKIADANVTTTKIADQAVNTQKLADQNVTTAKIADTNVTPAKLANSGNELGMRNRIINGAMVIDQRSSGTAVTPTAGAYTLDRFKLEVSQASKLTVQQVASTAPGFIKALKVTVASAYTLTASDFFLIRHFIEGVNVADLGFGTANAKSVVISFYVNASLTGTYSVAVRNGANSRAYITTFTVNAANTDEYKTIVVPGDVTGTWATDTSTGIELAFDLGTGSTRSTSATGAWQAGDYFKATGSVSLVANAGATFAVTGVQLEAGSVATPFERRPYGTELALCQRYYQNVNGAFMGVATGTTTAEIDVPIFAVMRATPTMTNGGNGTFIDGTTAAAITGASLTTGYSFGSQRVSITSTGMTQSRPVSAIGQTLQFSAEL